MHAHKLICRAITRRIRRKEEKNKEEKNDKRKKLQTAFFLVRFQSKLNDLFG